MRAAEVGLVSSNKDSFAGKSRGRLTLKGSSDMGEYAEN